MPPKCKSQTYIFNEFVRRHSRYNEKVTDDDAHVFGPAFTQRAPQVLHFVGQLVSKLQSIEVLKNSRGCISHRQLFQDKNTN